MDMDTVLCPEIMIYNVAFGIDTCEHDIFNY